jgi:hypothetical protein
LPEPDPGNTRAGENEAGDRDVRPLRTEDCVRKRKYHPPARSEPTHHGTGTRFLAACRMLYRSRDGSGPDTGGTLVVLGWTCAVLFHCPTPARARRRCPAPAPRRSGAVGPSGGPGAPPTHRESVACPGQVIQCRVAFRHRRRSVTCSFLASDTQAIFFLFARTNRLSFTFHPPSVLTRTNE